MVKTTRQRGTTRRRDHADKRAHRVQPTGKALQIGPAVEQIYNYVYMLAMQGITQEELDYFVNLFSRMSGNLARGESKRQE